MNRKIDARELLAALGGLLVLISLFLEWYERGEGALRGNGITAWEAFEALDLVLAALAVAAIATGAAALGTIAALGPRALLPIGAALAIIVVVQLVSPPPVAWGEDLGTGAWLGLAGSLIVLAAGILRAARVDVTVRVSPRDARRRVAAVDRRPAAAAPAEPVAPDAGRMSVAPSEPVVPAADRAPERRSLLDEPDPQATQPFKPVDGER